MITIVSGLPRSGTSLMMQMLQAGGMQILADQVRQPDESNPRGYYEYEKVKQLKDHSDWLNQAEQKAVKVISMLLYDLPAEFDFRIIFMLRDLSEILASQEKMLTHRGVEDKGPEKARMNDHFNKHLEDLKKWLDHNQNMDVYYCNFNLLISNPRPMLTEISQFLNLPLHVENMVETIDSTLYRQRSAE